MATWKDLASGARTQMANARVLTGQAQLAAINSALDLQDQLLQRTLVEQGGGGGGGARPPVPQGYTVFSRQTYDTNSPRGWGNLGFPAAGAGDGRLGLVMIHGGGWMQGDPNVAAPSPAPGEASTGHVGLEAFWRDHDWSYGGPIPAERMRGVQGQLMALRAMSGYLNARGWVTWEPAYNYSTGNPDVCLASVKAAVAWFLAHREQFGVGRVVVAGHSAGGQLAIRYAQLPDVEAPALAVGLAAAGLYITPQTQDFVFNQQMGSVERIFQAAWGPRAGWEQYSPHAHLQDRPVGQRCPILLEVGCTDSNPANPAANDTQIPTSWARLFQATAKQAGWTVTARIQPRTDHFSVARWDSNQTTLDDLTRLAGK